MKRTLTAMVLGVALLVMSEVTLANAGVNE